MSTWSLMLDLISVVYALVTYLLSHPSCFLHSVAEISDLFISPILFSSQSYLLNLPRCYSTIPVLSPVLSVAVLCKVVFYLRNCLVYSQCVSVLTIALLSCRTLWSRTRVAKLASAVAFVHTFNRPGTCSTVEGLAENRA
ncbi:uncharacterized protein SCHCODRAFT_02243717 [Schizophyllum commune H4-8]|uniref:uncharacterized protein n=1 Tax=Schizophyllum commune (strain H4-8 / FGSC 9210) TaxID=578458 RepID=UPI00215E496E|nr:uncharacterized protein SCHCODRAFT_02243717 [Schizophyllum commune H4-8]KAI5893030.1 hypothetical protein SCHCODRAFT_02243717 [Schizophyllum commune H4-8]